jgi:hypothetical protein
MMGEEAGQHCELSWVEALLLHEALSSSEEGVVIFFVCSLID